MSMKQKTNQMINTRIFNIKSFKGFTLGKEYLILDNSPGTKKSHEIIGSNDHDWIAFHYQYDGYVSPYEYFDYLSKRNAMRKKKIGKQKNEKKERFYIIDDFGKRRSFTRNELNMIFTNNSDDITLEIRNAKLNTLNI